MIDVWDACVIGAGPAGCTAAVQLARDGFGVILVEKEPVVGGLIRHAWRVENCPILTGQPGGAQVAKLLEEHIERWSIPIRRARVRSVERTGSASFRIESDGGVLEARAVIVCVGTVPKVPDFAVAGDVGLRFYPCDVPGDAKRAAVVGGGDAAFDYAISLAERGIEPVILVRSPRPRALKRLQDEVAARGIEVRLDAAVLRVERRKNSVRILLRTGEAVNADSVVIAIGRTSAAEGIALPSGIERSERSGLPMSSGLWLAGDVWRGRIRQMSIAVGDGLAAAMEAAEFLRESGGVP